jgi:hypothetical protein
MRKKKKHVFTIQAGFTTLYLSLYAPLPTSNPRSSVFIASSSGIPTAWRPRVSQNPGWLAKYPSVAVADVASVAYLEHRLYPHQMHPPEGIANSG